MDSRSNCCVCTIKTACFESCTLFLLLLPLLGFHNLYVPAGITFKKSAQGPDGLPILGSCIFKYVFSCAMGRGRVMGLFQKPYLCMCPILLNNDCYCFEAILAVCK